MENLYTLETFDLPKELFGNFISQGIENSVYIYAPDPTYVIKITKNPYTNKNLMLKDLSEDKFNEVPNVVKKQLLGYLTIKNKFYPVWIQKKVSNLLKTYDKETYKKLANIMIDKGFFPTTFKSNTLKVCDLHPSNISSDINIIDCLTYDY